MGLAYVLALVLAVIGTEKPLWEEMIEVAAGHAEVPSTSQHPRIRPGHQATAVP
jgi:hypothetical protein